MIYYHIFWNIRRQAVFCFHFYRKNFSAEPTIFKDFHTGSFVQDTVKFMKKFQQHKSSVMKRNGTWSGVGVRASILPKAASLTGLHEIPQVAIGFSLSCHYILSTADSVAVKKTYLVLRWRVINDKLKPVTQHVSEKYVRDSTIFVNIGGDCIVTNSFSSHVFKSLLQNLSLSDESPAYLISAIPYSKYIKRNAFKRR